MENFSDTVISYSQGCTSNLEENDLDLFIIVYTIYQKVAWKIYFPTGKHPKAWVQILVRE